MTAPSYGIKNLDHLGLVAGMCQELQLAEAIDAVIPKTNTHHVSHGQALVAMILNGLGFHSRTLHMFPGFFADKPTERLIGPGILPEHLNDDTLGRCLDALYETNVSILYQVLAERVVEKLGLKADSVHLDITSFHVDGEYARASDDETGCLRLVRGYSRDHRPELNQVVLELMCENQAGIPVYMQALSGNTNDQKAFAEVARLHLKSLKAAQQSRYLVGDAALYNADILRDLQRQEQLFVTRVPMTLNIAKQHVRELDATKLEELGDGYHGCWLDSDYGGVSQRWLLLRSEQAARREQATVEKHLKKDSTQELKQFRKLCTRRFACEQDAWQALDEFRLSLRLLRLEQMTCHACPVYSGRGRPGADEQPQRYEYQLSGLAVTCLDNVADARARTGVFILATNDLNGLSMQALLDTYKSQQRVERGFRFLKSPEFLTSAVFLKKPERIEALLMVMTCSLMIYVALEHRIRTGLKAHNQTFPDMKKKPCQNPTARWVFLCFSGLHELTVGEGPPLVVNLQPRQQVIIDVLGERYRRLYS